MSAANLSTKSASNNTVQPPAIGNFALPTSQQPGGLLSFGQNIIGKGQKQIYLVLDGLAGSDKYAIEFAPGFLYAFTDFSSIFIVTPVALRFQEGSSRSSGLEDAGIQFEYAYYTKNTRSSLNQATVVLRATGPSGSATINPATGIGGYSLMVGGTFVRTEIDWLLFASSSYVFTTAHQSTKYGNSFLYQAGIGRNILSIKDRFIFNWLVEMSGEYDQRNRVSGVIDPNSGGNIIFITPSLWYSGQVFIFQIGAGVPIYQHLFGNQKRTNYLAIASLGWTF